MSWNTVVDALAGSGHHLVALDLFREMQRDRPDRAPVTYTVHGMLGGRAG